MSDAVVKSGSHSGAGIVWRVLPDERLVGRACKGNQQAFAAIFRRYHRGLYRYCLAILGNGADAQDALQNAMVKVLRALPGETRTIQLKPWLYRIAHNESVELLRRRRPDEPLDLELAVSAGSPEATVELRERLRRLVADLGELPERQRGALVMRELADLDFAEIGAAFDTSAEVARQTIYEARQSLRQIERGREMSCVAVTKTLSDADGRTLRRRDIGAHLRSCAECRTFGVEIGERRADLAALAPLPGVVASGLLHGLLAGQAPTGGGLTGAIGSGVGKVIGASALTKTASTVALVAVVGVAAGDRAGLIHLDASSSAPYSRSIETAAPAPPDRGASPAAGQGQEPSTTPKQSGPRAVAHTNQPNPQTAKALDKGTQSGQLPGEGGGPVTPEGQSDGGAHSDGQAEGLPAASAHGQETAAANRGRGKGLPVASAHGRETAATNRGHGKSASHAPGKGQAGADKAGLGAKGTPPDRSPQEHPGHEPGKPADSPPAESSEPEPMPNPQAEAHGKSKEAHGNSKS